MRRRLLISLVAAVAAAAVVSAPAGAQERTVTGTGIGGTLVKRPVKLGEASIQAAVDAADRVAEQQAVRAAQAQARSLAAAAGLTLGAIVSVDQGGDIGFFALLVGSDGSGDSDTGSPPFCRPETVYRGKRRVPVRRTVCHVPRQAFAVARVVYAAS